ncbi:hypothetical protein HAALTHF_51240n [Vreelandella aquamarina]|nr:hypothetical protein HAALTHF_51240n [Halomonas axialensis]
MLDVGERSVAAHIADWAASTPDVIAIEEQGRTLSYAQLEARISDIARWLDGQGVKRGDYVALNLPRSTDLVVLLLAVWRAGAAYLPLDPEWPEARKRRVLEDAQPVLVVSAEKPRRNPLHWPFPASAVWGCHKKWMKRVVPCRFQSQTSATWLTFSILLAPRARQRCGNRAWPTAQLRSRCHKGHGTIGMPALGIDRVAGY